MHSYPGAMEAEGDSFSAETHGPDTGEAARWSRPTRPLAWVLLPVAVLIPLASLALWRIALLTGSPAPHGLWHQAWTAFDIGAEGTVVVWYAASLWLLLGLLAALAAVLAPRHRLSWWLFAAVCTVAAADEEAALHERMLFLGDRLRPYVPFDVHYSWVIPGTIIAIVVAALLARLVLALRRRVTLTLVVAGTLFLLGALVIETLTGFVERDHGGFSDTYVVLTYVEEACELVGVSLAVVGLASMFPTRREGGVLSVRFDGYRRRAA